MTSFPARIDSVWIAISTILLQSVKPDLVELWLANEQFLNGIKDLPENLIRLRDFGLEINFCDDLRSHKKYYYSMLKHPDDIIITFDDDIYYPLDSIEKVFRLHEKYPNDVIGMSTCIFNRTNLLKPLEWEMNNSKEYNKNNLGICGGSCTLFPPHVLNKNAFDKKAIKKLAPLADDLWLTAMVYMNGRRVSSVGRLPFPISIPNTQEEALTTTNNAASSIINNNTQWSDILNYYHDDLNEWINSLV